MSRQVNLWVTIGPAKSQAEKTLDWARFMAMVIGLPVLNHRLLSGSAVLDILFICFGILALTLVHKTRDRSKRFDTAKEAGEWVAGWHPVEGGAA